MAKIRVGMVRVDTHAYYYGALMQNYDPALLSAYRHCAHYYFVDIYDSGKMMVPVVRSFEIVKVWSDIPEAAERYSATFLGAPKICKSFADVSDGVDLVFIAGSNSDGSQHRRFATVSLRKGVPTFVDKPLAYDLRDARAMVGLAKKHNTPMMSLSILSEVPHAAQFRRRFAEIAPVEFGTVKGSGETLAGQIHLISLARRLFGNGVESVECMGRKELAHVYLDYGSKAGRPKAGVVLNCASGGTDHCSLYASAYSSRGAVHSPRIGDFEFPYGAARILRKIRRMVQMRRPQASYADMLEGIAVATAARQAQKTCSPVFLKDL